MSYVGTGFGPEGKNPSKWGGSEINTIKQADFNSLLYFWQIIKPHIDETIKTQETQDPIQKYADVIIEIVKFIEESSYDESYDTSDVEVITKFCEDVESFINQNKFGKNEETQEFLETILLTFDYFKNIEIEEEDKAIEAQKHWESLKETIVDVYNKIFVDSPEKQIIQIWEIMKTTKYLLWL